MAMESSSRGEMEQKLEIMKEIKSHQVALAELNSLSSSKSVYQKNGNLFFRTTAQKAAASEQKLLDKAKSRLQNLNSA